jgi:hypothetical protein
VPSGDRAIAPLLLYGPLARFLFMGLSRFSAPFVVVGFGAQCPGVQVCIFAFKSVPNRRIRNLDCPLIPLRWDQYSTIWMAKELNPDASRSYSGKDLGIEYNISSGSFRAQFSPAVEIANKRFHGWNDWLVFRRVAGTIELDNGK